MGKTVCERFDCDGNKVEFWWEDVKPEGDGISKEPIETACSVIDLYRRGEKKYFTSKAPFAPDLYNLMVLSQISQLREVAEHISVYCDRREEEIDNMTCKNANGRIGNGN